MSIYAGISIPEVDALDYLDYLRYRRDAFIQRCEKTETGREYLMNAWRITQTAPDKESLREHFGKKKEA